MKSQTLKSKSSTSGTKKSGTHRITSVRNLNPATRVKLRNILRPPPVDVDISNKYDGESLNHVIRNAVEHSTGIDLGEVRVHDDEASHGAAEKVNARAFTCKGDIWLGRNASQNDLHLMAHEAVHVVQQRQENSSGVLQRKETRSDQADRLKDVSTAAHSTAKAETKVSTAEAHWAKKLDTVNLAKISKVLHYLKTAIIDLETGAKKVDSAMVKLKEAIKKITATKKDAKEKRAGGFGEYSAIAIFIKAKNDIDKAKSLLGEGKSKGINGLDVWIKKITTLSSKCTTLLANFRKNKRVSIPNLETFRDDVRNLRNNFKMKAFFKDAPIAAKKIQFVLRYFLSLNLSGFSNVPTLKEATDIRAKLGSVSSDMVLVFGGTSSDYSLFSNFEEQIRKQILVRSEMKKKMGIDPGLQPSEGNIKKWFKSLKKSSNSDVVDAYRNFAGGYFIHRHEPDPAVIGAQKTLNSLFSRPTTISGSRLAVCTGFAVLGRSLLEMAGAKFKKYFVAIRASDYQIKCSQEFDDVHALAHITRRDLTIKSAKLKNMYVSNDDIVSSKSSGIGPDAVAWTNKSNPLYEGKGSTLKGATKNAVAKIDARRKALGEITCQVK